MPIENFESSEITISTLAFLDIRSKKNDIIYTCMYFFAHDLSICQCFMQLHI